jgi:hypothetical protein
VRREGVRELATEVKERTVAAAKAVAERVESFFDGGGGKEGALPESAPAKEQEPARPPTLSIEEQLDQKVGELDRKLTAQESIEARLANLDQRMDAQAREQQEKELKQQQEIEPSRDRSRGFGIER